MNIEEDESIKRFMVNFYSDFSQLKYVFAEVAIRNEINNSNSDVAISNDTNKSPIEAKIKILEDEAKIIEDINLKFKEENDYLKTKINSLDNQISNLEIEVSSKENKINQFNIDTNELDFLRLNLEYGHKCRKTFLNAKGFKTGSLEYKNCVLNKGIINNG